MRDLLLYAAIVLIWGSTFAAIPYQLGAVAVEWSVAYRFGIASLALIVFARLSGRSLRLPPGYLPYVALQGVLMFSLNYFLVYYASAYVTTGLIAVLFSFIVLVNAGFEQLLFGVRLGARFYVAALLGVAGIACIFWPEIPAFDINDRTFWGIGLALGSVLSASLGNMAANLNTRRNMPVVALNAVAMGLAAAFSAGVALSLGRPPTLSLEAGYLFSLVYLAIPGSAIAFGCYLALIRSIGPSRASYATILFPIVALMLSTLLEGYRWTSIAIIGMILALSGNALVLSERNRKLKKEFS